METKSNLRDPAIELINVSRRFLTPDGKSMTAIRDFTMTVGRGEFVAVVGPTGCGKSTSTRASPVLIMREIVGSVVMPA